jgi:hypothetical protein
MVASHEKSSLLAISYPELTLNIFRRGTLMRFLPIAIVANMVVASLLITTQPAVACWTLGRTLFFREIPQQPSPKVDVILKVILEKVSNGSAIAQVLEVFQTPEGMYIQPGDKVRLQYVSTSCGPSHQAGQEGIIIAQLSGDGTEQILYPFTRHLRYRGDGGRIILPLEF